MVTTRRGQRQPSPVQSESDHEESDELGSVPTDEEEEQKNEDNDEWSNDDEEVRSDRRVEVMEQTTEVSRSTSSSTPVGLAPEMAMITSALQHLTTMV
ncbi:hypothetical protein PR002_g23044 [Phytophthora rubi]|uniref:Uncharacterized protein n=1 Tax=Phytophthora rubi TaxID=129364 RepID=A0A6A3IQU0_9STRA|nr:hypothetical protein PR002_g23044 [Phytophthora rubi]